MNINIIKHPQSQPHALENITIALDAIQEDGIKLVNIGESVIVNIFVQKQLGIKRISIGRLGPQMTKFFRTIVYISTERGKSKMLTLTEQCSRSFALDNNMCGSELHSIECFALELICKIETFHF